MEYLCLTCPSEKFSTLALMSRNGADEVSMVATKTIRSIEPLTHTLTADQLEQRQILPP